MSETPPDINTSHEPRFTWPELSPEAELSMRARDYVTRYWNAYYGDGLPADIAVQFGPNPGWATFLAEASQKRDAMLSVMDRVFTSPDGVVRREILEHNGELRQLISRISGYRQHRPKQVPEVADYQDQLYLHARATDEDTGYFVGSPGGGYFFFALNGELKRFSTEIGLAQSTGKPTALRRQVHLNRGAVTSLWLEVPNGTLFAPERTTPRYVTRGLERAGFNLYYAHPHDETYIQTKLEAFRTANPTATDIDVERKESALWRRMMQARTIISARAAQVLYYRVRAGQMVCEAGYRHRYRPKQHKGKAGIPSPHPLWAPNTPDRRGYVTHIASVSARDVPLEAAVDFLTTRTDIFWQP